MASKDTHYLREELFELMRTDTRIFEFLETGSLDGTWYWDLNAPDHEWMSDRMWEVFGYGPNEKPHLASAWQDMINPDDLTVAFAELAAHLADPAVPYDQVVRYTHKAGHTVWVRCRGIAIRDDSGKPVRMLGAHQDITELKQAEASLQAKNGQLARVNGELRRFAYAASHDIRAPAVTLRALLSRLQEKYSELLDDEGRELLSFAQQHAVRVAEMADRVLDYSQVTGAELLLEPLDVADVVAEVLEALEDTLSNAKALVSVTAMPKVVADRVMLRLAIHSLVENALTYNTSPEPRVDVVADWDEDNWSLSVADNGIGISTEHRKRIFSVFERLQRQDTYMGAGLGLAICAQVAAVHDGQIYVSDNEPTGTVFTLELAVNPQSLT
jgi:PAS domain S-box-containing protein